MSNILHDFTTTVPQWRPRVTPIKLEDATPDQLDALKVTPSNMKVSDYVLVLARDAETLRERTPLFNHCVYCAAVHASRYNLLAKDVVVIARIFADGEDAELNPRQSAIFNFAVKLSKCPPDMTKADMETLTAAGLGPDEVLDLILSSALFGWANRLMHILGDPTDITD